MRIWCRNEATEETFYDRVVIVSRLFGEPSEIAELIRRVYEREAPQVEVIRVVELALIEREFY
jgi:hypothetical protein